MITPSLLTLDTLFWYLATVMAKECHLWLYLVMGLAFLVRMTTAGLKSELGWGESYHLNISIGEQGRHEQFLWWNKVVHWLHLVQELYVGEFLTNKLPNAAVMVHGNCIFKKGKVCWIWMCQISTFSKTVLVILTLG